MRLVEELVATLVPRAQFPALVERRLVVFHHLRHLVDAERRSATRPYFNMPRQLVPHSPSKAATLTALVQLLHATPTSCAEALTGPVACIHSLMGKLGPMALFDDWSPRPGDPEERLRMAPGTVCAASVVCFAA